MKVSEALRTRKTIRAFKTDPVPLDTIKQILELAKRAPSGGNLQPWHVHVITGEPMQKLVETVFEKMPEKPMGEGAEYNIYPPKLKQPYSDRRFDIGERMYATLGIEREDRAGRLTWFANNFRFFGAPAAMIFSIDKQMCEGQWSDLGMFIQSIMLVAREFGLHTCPQEAWAIWQGTIREMFDIPEDRMVFCALGIGYADETAPVNRLESPRAPLEEFVEFTGF
ncbi:cnbA [Symbiodinium microadriaticum]|nr:cnbA [Symbiodinium microadriaticum]